MVQSSMNLFSLEREEWRRCQYKSDSIIYCINYMKPQKEQDLLTFIQSISKKRSSLKNIYPEHSQEKKFTKEQVTKLETK